MGSSVSQAGVREDLTKEEVGDAKGMKVMEGPVIGKEREPAPEEQRAALQSWGGGDGEDCWRRLFTPSPFLCPA